MTRLGWQAILAAVLAMAQSLAWSQTPKALAYQGWWMPQSWQQVPLQSLSRLFFFELKVDASGMVAERHGWPDEWAELQHAAQLSQLPIDLTLTLFDAKTFNTLFSADQAIQTLLTQCIGLAQHDRVAGLQLDFEIYDGATPLAIQRYRDFLGQLAQKLRILTPQRQLSVFLPNQEETALYDASSLTHLNFVVAQSYDTHYRDSQNAGPVAPLHGPDSLTWTSAAAQAVALGVPKDRLFLTFPLYGYEWSVKDNTPRSPTTAPGLTTTFAPVSKEVLPDVAVSVTERVSQFGATVDAVTGSSYYQFKNDQGQWVQGWFEDWWSLGRKIDFLKAEGLGGTAFFLLGYDQGELLNHYLQRTQARNLDALIDQVQRIPHRSP